MKQYFGYSKKRVRTFFVSCNSKHIQKKKRRIRKPREPQISLTKPLFIFVPLEACSGHGNFKHVFKLNLRGNEMF